MSRDDDKIIEYLQTWWHIEEIYQPYKSRKIRQVMDIATNSEIIPISIEQEFVGLRVFTRNSGRNEIAFLEKDSDDGFAIDLILGSLEDFPIFSGQSNSCNGSCSEDYGKENCNICSENKNPLKHVKIEIEWIEIKPIIHDLIESFSDKIRPKKVAQIEFKGRIQPEIYMTMPLGWRIQKNSIIPNFKSPNKIDEGKAVGIKSMELTKDGNQKERKYKVNAPFIQLDSGKRIYNYLISSKDISKFYQKIDDENEIKYYFTYFSELSTKITCISIFPIFFVIISTILLVIQILSWISYININLNPSIFLSYLLLLISFTFYYTNLYKEGYDIPLRQWYIPIFIYSILIFMVIFLSSILFVPDTTLIINMTFDRYPR